MSFKTPFETLAFPSRFNNKSNSDCIFIYLSHYENYSLYLKFSIHAAFVFGTKQLVLPVMVSHSRRRPAVTVVN